MQLNERIYFLVLFIPNQAMYLFLRLIRLSATKSTSVNKNENVATRTNKPSFQKAKKLRVNV